MRKIQLNNGLTALVDDEDFDWLNTYTWEFYKSKKHTNAKGYAFTRIKLLPGNGPGAYKHRSMHRLICLHYKMISDNKQMHVDHINGNTLNNCKSNLRKANRSQNAANKGKPQSAKGSRYKGVCWDTSKGKYKAYIKKNKRIKHLGYYIDEKEAAKAYNAAAKRLFGEFAYPNKL